MKAVILWRNLHGILCYHPQVKKWMRAEDVLFIQRQSNFLIYCARVYNRVAIVLKRKRYVAFYIWCLLAKYMTDATLDNIYTVLERIYNIKLLKQAKKMELKILKLMNYQLAPPLALLLQEFGDFNILHISRLIKT